MRRPTAEIEAETAQGSATEKVGPSYRSGQTTRGKSSPTFAKSGWSKRPKSEYVFASYLIRLRPDFTKVDPDYIVWFLNSSLRRQQVDATSRQIMQNNINSEELRSLQIPLPPLAVQQAMMERVAARRDKITKLKADAKALADASTADVEAMILGTKPVE